MLAPLAAGLVLYAFSRQVQFLALTLVSPIMMIGNGIEDRRSGRRTFRDELAAFRRDARVAVEPSSTERVRTSVPNGSGRPPTSPISSAAPSCARSTCGHAAVGASDFLRVRLGLATDSTAFDVELERGGDDDLRAEALDALAGVTDAAQRPGHDRPRRRRCDRACTAQSTAVDGLVDSLLAQAAMPPQPGRPHDRARRARRTRSMSWVKWLPHLRSVASPLAGPHLATDARAADRLVAGLLDVAAFRAAQTEGAERCAVWPRLLVVLDAAVGADPVETARLLDLGPAVGISVVWVSLDAAHRRRGRRRACWRVRRAAGAMVVGHLWATDPDVAPMEIEIESLRPDLADRVARSLAPVRDASTASLATSIPRTVGSARGARRRHARRRSG